MLRRSISLAVAAGMMAHAHAFEITDWKDDFGELVRRLAGVDSYDTYSSRGFLRNAELPATHGYPPEALLVYVR
jgi:hypothetical protein